MSPAQVFGMTNTTVVLARLSRAALPGRRWVTDGSSPALF
jgi:hypothetical protein